MKNIRKLQSNRGRGRQDLAIALLHADLADADWTEELVVPKDGIPLIASHWPEHLANEHLAEPPPRLADAGNVLVFFGWDGGNGHSRDVLAHASRVVEGLGVVAHRNRHRRKHHGEPNVQEALLQKAEY
eukprot:2435769-Rhodomonas_salina.2